MAFLDSNYLITNETGKRLFAAIRDLPVVDPHNHANVKEIAENTNYTDAWQLFAATDHYVWEMLRKRNVPERLITGQAEPKEKFLAMAKIFPELAGNPVYEWIHLDLKNYFGITEQLCEASGERIWDEVNAKLATDAYRPQQLLTGPLNVHRHARVSQAGQRGGRPRTGPPDLAARQGDEDLRAGVAGVHSPGRGAVRHEDRELRRHA